MEILPVLNEYRMKELLKGLQAFEEMTKLEGRQQEQLKDGDA